MKMSIQDMNDMKSIVFGGWYNPVFVLWAVPWGEMRIKWILVLFFDSGFEEWDKQNF